jgi:CTP synthase (UTP-ammonia lyase)
MTRFFSAMKTIAVIGDFKPDNPSHLATNEAIRHCSEAAKLNTRAEWIGTEEILKRGTRNQLEEFGGLWIAPASPYKSMEGALLAIRTARERSIPLLGTCGGFQHIILEYARNVLGITDAEHEETSPGASQLFISRLDCSLVGRTMTIALDPQSLIARLYGRATAQEQYYCNFGVNPKYLETLFSREMRVVASDAEGIARAVEIPSHPFFIGTLFLPQHHSSAAAPHPLIIGFVKAAATAV